MSSLYPLLIKVVNSTKCAISKCAMGNAHIKLVSDNLSGCSCNLRKTAQSYDIKQMINATALQLKNYGIPMHLGGLLSTQKPRVDLGHSYASFMLSNLPCTSITQWLPAEHLERSNPFVNYIYGNQKEKL